MTMDRKEFIRLAGAGAGMALLAGCFQSCSSEDAGPGTPTNVDFTLDVSSGPLATNGGFVVQNGVIIARTNVGDFIAVSSACTHQGTTVQFQASQNRFNCPNHNSNFNLNGSVINGPASRPLTQYQTSLSGSSLRVFS
jgi:cytochrome b6-f complex iron-sulfur subunit